jgi:hypothetical protein
VRRRRYNYPVSGFATPYTAYVSKSPVSLHNSPYPRTKSLLTSAAESFLAHFDAATIRIITEKSSRLQEVPSIGKHLPELMTIGWNGKFAVNDVTMFL